MLRANHKVFVKHVSNSLDTMNAKLDVLRVCDRKLSKTVDFEFGNLQEGMFRAAKSWKK